MCIAVVRISTVYNLFLRRRFLVSVYVYEYCFDDHYYHCTTTTSIIVVVLVVVLTHVSFH